MCFEWIEASWSHIKKIGQELRSWEVPYHTKKWQLKVIYCVFRPAFGCCIHPKAGWNTFFSHFEPFLFISNLFQQFHAWKKRKKLFFLIFVCSSKLVDMQKLVESQRGYLEIVYFWLICYKFIQGFRVTCLFTGQYNTK